MPVIERTEFASKNAERWPFRVICDKAGCFHMVSCRTKEEADRDYLEHVCPRKGPTVHRKSTYEKIWDELDLTMTEIKTTGDSPAKEKAKSYALGLAFALAEFKHITLDTVDAIRREANARYKMRTGEMEFRPTQGYVFDVKQANFSPEAIERAKKEAAETVERSADTTRPKSVLTDKQKIAVQAGLAGGMNPQDLATLYKVPLEAVRALV